MKARYVRPTSAHTGTDEFGHRRGGSGHLERPLLEALAVLRQIGYPTTVLVHSVHDRLPRPATQSSAVKKDDGRPFHGTRLAHTDPG